VVIVYISNIMLMKVEENKLYSAYQIYRQYTSVDMAVEKLGVCEAFIVDMREAISGKKDSGELSFQMVSVNSNTGNDFKDINNNISDINLRDIGDTDDKGLNEETTGEDIEPVDTSPNVLDIDFDEINKEAQSDGISSLSAYFQSLKPTNKNEYTGMFQGYNVIVITAEGFSGYALESGLFPNLSKLANEGFVFNNYYQPLWYGSTLGGEYANLMGSPTKNGEYLSMYKAGTNENGMIFSLANQLNRKGYTSIGYHNNDYTYYDRNITHTALGYDWRANGSGLPEQYDENGDVPWPQSDLIMVQDTVDEWIDKQPFNVYYLTVSGHVIYSYDSNYISRKNWDIVENLDYSETTKAYLASQYELEAAVTELLDELESHDLLDNTLIVLAGDHVPYDNMYVLDELAGYMLEDDFEEYKSSLIIWSASMSEPIEVDKVCSSIDILPTVSNLLGLEYDSRLIIGQDILSDSQGLVIFPDRSFITDDFSYNANIGNIVSYSKAEISETQVENMKSYVADKFTAANSITELNYYRYVEKYLSTNK
ncbi:MAG: LTA synthase family protein, partial [Coprococcus sp.]